MKKKLFVIGLTSFLLGCSSNADVKYEYPSKNEYERKNVENKMFGDETFTFKIRPTVKKLAETPEEIALAEQQAEEMSENVEQTKIQNEKIKQLDTQVSELKEQIQQINQNQTIPSTVVEQQPVKTIDFWDKAMAILVEYPLEQSNKQNGFISTEWFNVQPKKQIKYNVFIANDTVNVTALVRTYEADLGWINQKNDQTLADQIKNDILK